MTTQPELTFAPVPTKVQIAKLPEGGVQLVIQTPSALSVFFLSKQDALNVSDAMREAAGGLQIVSNLLKPS